MFQSIEQWLRSAEAWLQQAHVIVTTTSTDLQGAPTTTSILSTPVEVVAARLGIAFVLGCIAAGIHYWTSRRRLRPNSSEPALAATLVLLAVLIALVMMVIGDSLARAFGLAGALAIVRFRTVVEDTRDTAFVMFAVIAGMAAGTGHLVGPIVCTPVVLLAAWLFRARVVTEVRRRTGTLVLRLTAGKPPDERITTALKAHLGEYRLTGLATARGGSALDASYEVDLPDADKVFAVTQELGRLEGVQGVELKEA